MPAGGARIIIGPWHADQVHPLVKQELYGSRAFLQEGYFWEAHEMFESIWMACPPNAPEKLLVQSLIQDANAALKRRMGREQAAVRLDAEARRLQDEAFGRSRGPILGLVKGR